MRKLNKEKANGESELKVADEVKKPLGSIDLDDVERPLRVVEECMHRLELQHQLNEQTRYVGETSSDSDPASGDTSEESSKSEEYVLADTTKDNPLMGRSSVRGHFCKQTQPLTGLFFAALEAQFTQRDQSGQGGRSTESLS